MTIPVNRAHQSMATGEQEHGPRLSVGLPLPLSDLLAFVNDCDVAEASTGDRRQRSPPAKPQKQRKRALPEPDNASSESSSGLPAKAKRVRKHIRELQGLREESKELSRTLESMKQDVRDREQHIIKADAQAQRKDAKPKDDTAQSWANAAARTLLQRNASESEQSQLQESLQEQARMAELVKQILAKATTDEVLKELQQKPKRPPALGAMNMKEQIETLDALYQECERVFLANGFADDSAKAFNTVQMKKDANNGLMVELRSNIVVDYDLSTTTAAQWRIAKGGQVNRHFIYEETTEMSEDMLSREFGFQTKLDLRETNYRGRHTTRKYDSDQGTIYVWYTRVIPLDATSGSSASFFPLRTKGWKWVRRTSESSADAPCTCIQSYCQIIPDLEDATLGDLEQHRDGINALLEFSKKVEVRTAEIVADMLREIENESKRRALDN